MTTTDRSRASAGTFLPLVLSALVMFIDGYDLNAMPLVVPHLSEQLGAAPEDFGLALSAVLIGLGIGALFIAPYGDRIGRRPMILASVGVMAVTTFGTATGGSISEFVLWRLGTGLGLGACLPNVTALVADLSPQLRRARTLTLVSMGISFGGISAGILGPILVEIGGWQAIFEFGAAATVALLVALWFWLPEGAAKFDEESSQAGVRGAQGTSAFARLLKLPLLISTLLFAGLYAVNALVLYYIVSWVPTILPEAGFTVAAAARFLSLIQFGGLVVGLGLSFLLDRGLAVMAMAGTYACVVLALLALLLVPSGSAGWGVLLVVAGGGISAAHLAIMAVAIGFFPRDLLSSAIGIAVAVARLGAVGGPLLGGMAIAAGAGPGTFFALAAIPAAICIAAACFIPTAQRAGQRAADAG